MKLFIASSASSDIPKKYLQDCQEYLDCLFKENHDLVFGASEKGIMGLSYHSALNHQRNIIGIYPQNHQEEVANLNFNESIVTPTISQRTDNLIKECDALIFLPGGIGTMQEFFTALEYMRNQVLSKPIIIYNSQNYFTPLYKLLNKIYTEHFANTEVQNYYHLSNSIEDTIQYLQSYSNMPKLIKKQ